MYLDGTLLQPSAIAYGANNSTYSIAPGTYNLKIAPTGTTTYPINDNIDFGPGKNYNMFLLNVNNTLQPEVAEVALNTLGYDTSEIRFLNFCPNSPVVDIAFNLLGYTNTNIFYYDTTYTIYTGRYYNDQYDNSAYKAFTLLPSGQYNFKIRYTDSTLAIDSMNISLAPGASYTIYARGYFDTVSTLPPFIVDTLMH
jgi:hypothetical protein